MPAIALASPWLVLAPLMLVLAGLIGLPLLDPNRLRTRLLIVGGVAMMALVYGWWRLSITIPWSAPWPALGFALLVLAVELLGHFDSAILYAALVRRTNRSAEANAHEARLRARPKADLPAVDVVIATYNEPLAVLEKTIIGALALDWPDARIWVANDGRRAWLKDWCIAKGAGYIIRPDNAHAKAGNINHALEKTQAPFMAILDADFVPQQNWLMRCMGFFEAANVGIVQVPHSFYNHDPLQQNLAMRDAIPDDQRFFFEAIMPGRDGWDAAFCCGSNGIIRRKALSAVGGKLPGGSITEDMLLTLVMLRKGYITRYLSEPLAYGLAPESMTAFFVQRARWAQGGIQLLFLKEGPLGPGLQLRQRLFFMPTAWASQAMMLLLALVSPLVFLFLDVPPLVGVTAESAVFFLVPMVVAQVGGIVLLGQGRYYPIATLVLGTFQSFKLLPVILKTLWQPHGHAFKVTPKGSDAIGGGMERGIFIACTALMLATMAGLVINALPDWRIVAQGALVPMVAFWGALNVVVLFLAAMLCLGRPSPRAEERFAVDETVAVWRRNTPSTPQAGNLVYWARGLDLSLSGIGVAAVGDADSLVPGEQVRVRLAGVGTLEGKVARRARGLVGIVFTTTDSAVRDRLIVRLFTRGANVRPAQPPLWQVTWALLSRIWAADMTSQRPAPIAPADPALEAIPPKKLAPQSYALPPARMPPALPPARMPPAQMPPTHATRRRSA